MADKPKVWLMNEGQFPMIDPESGVRFEPGEPKRAELTDWARLQPTIQRVANPDDDPTEKDLKRIADQNAADEAERQAREAAAEKAQREANLMATIEAHPAGQAAAAAAAPAAGEAQ